MRPALIGRVKRRPQVIVIDPGHGGPDKGMINERLNLFEKDLYARYLAAVEKNSRGPRLESRPDTG